MKRGGGLSGGADSAWAAECSLTNPAASGLPYGGVLIAFNMIIWTN